LKDRIRACRPCRARDWRGGLSFGGRGVFYRAMSESIGRCEARPFELKELARTPDYLEYLECFNGGRFYEAHDALEPLWLRVRDRSEGRLLKGLIQLAGAFVHVQRGRVGPARALLVRARFHLEPFLTQELALGVSATLQLIREWEERLTWATAGDKLLADYRAPTLAGRAFRSTNDERQDGAGSANKPVMSSEENGWGKPGSG
jgi:hypothetical protein